MRDNNKLDFDDKTNYYSKEIHRMLLFYQQLNQLLETFFSGDLIIITDEINRNYLRLCNKIKIILEKTDSFHGILSFDWQPFDNLRNIDPDIPEADWEYSGKQICNDFLSNIENLFINTGEKTFPLDIDDQQFLGSIQSYLKEYLTYKREQEAKWLQKITKQAENWRNQPTIHQKIVQDFDFSFIHDEEIKKLLIKDWNELQEAFKNELYKSTIILCGTILESLLIATLSKIEEKAKLNYYQKYLEGKDKGNKSPEIEYWQLYQLIEISKKQGIISPDVAKLSHIVRDYRNLIHQWVQKRGGLQINSNVANAVVNLLTLTYNDILEWHKNENK